MSERTRAFGYTRLSQDSDTSIERQKRNIQTYVDEHDMELIEILNDGTYASGFDDHREEYQKLRESIKNGIDVVIVNDIRRLSRDFDQSMQLILDMRSFDVDLHTVESGEVDLSDPVSAAVEVLQAGVEHESKKKEIARSKESVKERLEAGYWHGRPPHGLQFDDDSQYLVGDETLNECMDVIRLHEQGFTFGEIEERTGVPSSTAQRVVERKEMYEKVAEGHCIGRAWSLVQ